MNARAYACVRAGFKDPYRGDEFTSAAVSFLIFWNRFTCVIKCNLVLFFYIKQDGEHKRTKRFTNAPNVQEKMAFGSSGLLRILATTAFCTQEETIDFLKRKCLLAQNAWCPSCGTAMHWQKCSKLSDGYQWRCPRSTCRKKLSIRNGSFFSRSHLSLQTWLKLIYFWATDEPVMKVHQQLDRKECSTKTAIDAFNFLREVCSQSLINLGNIELGGPGSIVQIDESLFNHKPKYHRGRGVSAAREQWVFGMVDCSVKPAIGYMELVDKRDAATLLPLVQQHTKPGTTVHSDQWRAYSRIGQMPGLTHGTVNHSLNFVDPNSGIHTQTVESYWSRAKAKLKVMRGTSAQHLPGYLDEYMWKERFGRNQDGQIDIQVVFSSILRDIATIPTLNNNLYCIRH